MKEEFILTEITLDNIIGSPLFPDVLAQLTILNHYVAGGTLLNLNEKRTLYLMAVAWINSNLEKSDKEKISKILSLNNDEVEQLDEAAIKEVFPHLRNVLAKHTIIWHLLSDTEFHLEEEAEKLIYSGENYQKTIIALQQARQTFIKTRKKMVKDFVEDAAQPNKRAWVETYVATMEKHFALWRKSIIPLEISIHSQFFIDLTYLDLRKLDLRNIPLQHVNLSRSRLAGTWLTKTGISAVQLSQAKEFSLAADLSSELILAAQDEQYKDWTQRLEERTKIFHTFRARMDACAFNKNPDIAQDSNIFEFAVKHCERLNKLEADLNKHIDAQSLEKKLLNDLTAEQQSAIYLALAQSEKEESLLKSELTSLIYNARCDLCAAYFEEIEKNLLADNLYTALKLFNDLLVLMPTNKENDPLPQDLAIKIQALRERLLGLGLASIQNLLARSEKKKEIQEESTKTLKQIHSMLNHTLEWALPLDLEVAVNKVRRDLIRYRIELEIEQNNFLEAEKLIEKLLSEEEINTQAERCFNELKYYTIELTDEFLEKKVTLTAEQSKLGKIYISIQKNKDYLIFGMDGLIYRGALSGEQISAAKELSRLLRNPKHRKSILLKIAKESYIHLKFDLRLQIVEKLIQKSEIEQASGQLERASGELYGDDKKLKLANSRLEHAHSKLELARNRMHDIIVSAKMQKYTLDLREKSAFKNEAFWEGISVKGIRIYLAPKQVQALGERGQHYNETLFFAIENGNLEEIKYGIEYFSWRAYSRNESGCTSVVFACLHGHFDIARYVYENGGVVSTILTLGKTDVNPLDELIQDKYRKDKERYEPIIRWLIDLGLELEPKNALLLNDTELFKMSLAQLPDDDSKKEKMRELLQIAVEEGSDIIVGWMLENQKDCVTSFPKVESKTKFFSFLNEEVITVPEDLPLLHIACKKGRAVIVTALLKDPNTAGSTANKQSALLNLAQSFIEQYPHPDEDPREFQTLYETWKHIAVKLCRHGARHNLYTWLILNDNLEGIELYLNKDTMNKPCDAEGNTPLHFAVKTGNIELVRFLIKNKAFLEPINSKQETPLHLACVQGHLGIVKCLLEAKVSPDGPRRELTTDEKKQLSDLVKVFPEMNSFVKKKPLRLETATPLQCAISNKHPAIVEILCQYKADLETKPNGTTALHSALILGRQERDTQEDRISVQMVAILLKYGAQVSTLDDKGELPWLTAVRTRNIKAMILLLEAYVAQSPEPRDDATQKAVLFDLYKIEAKERFCDELEQWAQSFRAALHISESELAESSIVTKAPPFASTLSSSSSASSSALSSSSSLSSSCSMFPPVKSNPKPFTSVGAQFDRHLQEHFQESENAPSDLDSDSDYFSNHHYEDLCYTPPEEREPFYVIPSSPEELEADDKEKEEERGSPFRFGYGSS